MTTIDDILDEVETQILALDLVIGTESLAVAKYKLPVRQSRIDPARQLIVCPAEQPGPTSPWVFKRVEHTHLIDLVLVAPNSNDQVSYLPELTEIALTLVDFFSKPPAWNLPTRKVTARHKVMFDRRAIADLKLDILTVEVAVTAVERVVS